MIKTHIDKNTLKPIEYFEESIFVIYTKGGYHKKRALRFFTSDKIIDALQFFYGLEVPVNQRKYLMIHHRDHLAESEGKMIYNMKGYYPNAKELKLKLGRHMVSYRYKATLNLVKTPESIAKKLALVDFSKLPVKHEKWSKTKLIYCLLSYFFSLNDSEKHDLMDKAFRLYTSEKLQSGGKEDEANDLRELVAMESL